MSGPLIGTHNGHFHADEALAVYLLRLLPDYANSTLLRTRDAEKLNTCHTVVDVGGTYEDEKRRYDHHQREFNTNFPNHSTKLSSAGLVYMHYGKRIIAECCPGLSQEDVTLLYEKLYDDFVEAFDANDNGISAYDPNAIRQAGIERRFSEKGFSMASVVNRLNYSHPSPVASATSSLSTEGVSNQGGVSVTTGTDPAKKSPEQLQAEEDERFLKASQFVGEQFVSELMDKYHAWLPARAAVKQAFAERNKYDSKGRIMVISGGMPWADHLYNLEKENNAEGNVLYVLFPEKEEDPQGRTRIRSVSKEAGSFENRKDLPDAWKGVRDEELSKVSGVPGGVFVHASGFIGGNQTFEGALGMAKKAVDM